MKTSYAVDFTVVHLTPTQWDKLAEVATRRPGKWVKGGWQSRLRKWCSRMNEAERSIMLSHAAEGRERIDDMTFVARAIEQKEIGGWQRHAHVIFAGSHRRFSNIKVIPRPERWRA